MKKEYNIPMLSVSYAIPFFSYFYEILKQQSCV
jgi:hypothetical protein